jgi:hypothetical protein
MWAGCAVGYINKHEIPLENHKGGRTMKGENINSEIVENMNI